MKASLKPLILINICILILFFACSLPGVKGSGKVERENRTIGSFNELHVSGMFDVYMREGNTPSVEVVADDNLLPIIRTELKGSRLKVYTDENIRDQPDSTAPASMWLTRGGSRTQRKPDVNLHVLQLS